MVEDIPETLLTISSSRPIVSARPVFGAIGGFAKKVTRRCLAWYVHPITEDQTRFNATLVREFRALQERVAAMESDGAVRRPSGSAPQACAATVLEVLGESPLQVVLISGTDTPLARTLLRAHHAIAPALGSPVHALHNQADATLDAVVLDATLARLSPRETVALMREARRTLRPGGRLISALPTSAMERDPSELDVSFLRWVHPELAAAYAAQAGYDDTTHIDIVDSPSPWFVSASRS